MLNGLLQDKRLKQVLHFCLLVIVLIIFSKLTLDAVILGAIAMYIYQTGGRQNTSTVTTMKVFA